MILHSSFGAWLQYQRGIRNLSREACALSIGCSWHTIRHLEKDTRRPSKALLERIFQILDISEEEQVGIRLLARQRQKTSSQERVQSQTCFIGRDHECALLHELICDPLQRLITVLGAPGVGKTRLVSEVAQQVSRHTELQVYSVPLHELKESQFFVQTLLTMLNVKVMNDPQTSLYTALRATPTLLILDTMEHLLDVAPLVGEILEQVPTLTIIATSRVPLQLYGEYQFWLDPLKVPQQNLDGTWINIETAESVQLLVARIYERGTYVALRQADYNLIAAICVQLNGLPLSLEIVASHTNVLSIEALYNHLQRVCPLRLTYDSVQGQPHHQSLWSAIEWSYYLLPETTQHVWQVLSLIGEGWTMECAALILDMLEVEVHEHCTRLVEHSLIRYDETTSLPRWYMLESIRFYGLEKVASNPNHLHMCMERVVQAVVVMLDTNQTTYTQIFLNLPAVRTALNWTSTNHQNIAYHLLERLCSFWVRLGMAEEGIWWIDHILEGRTPTTLQEACIIKTRADLAAQCGQYTHAEHWYRRVLEFTQALGDTHATYEAWTGLGLMTFNQGDMIQAEEALSKALMLSNPETVYHWRAVGNLCLVYGTVGRYKEALNGLNQVLIDTHRCGDVFAYALTLLNISINMWCLGQSNEALKMVDQSLTILKGFPSSHNHLSALTFRCYILLPFDALNVHDIAAEVEPTLRELLKFPETMLYHRHYIDVATVTMLYLISIKQYYPAVMIQGAIEQLRKMHLIPHNSPYFITHTSRYQDKLSQQVDPVYWQTLIATGAQFSLSELYRFVQFQLSTCLL